MTLNQPSPGAADSSGGIAIIGMAGRFPGAKDVDAFWDNLREGKESISFFDDRELRDAGVPDALLHDPRYVKASPILHGFDAFDAAFFDSSPREARLMDPQHRLFLECAWEALENAGYDPRNVSTPVGVFAGAGGLFSSYFFSQMRADQSLIGRTASLEHIANDKDFLTTRVSYQLNLRGPSVNVQTACSTSLVAVHLACQSLLCGECAMALAGGVTIRVPHLSGYLYEEGGILSPDGHCRAFDAAAQGTIFGSGLGIVVLKRLDEALASGDCIRAVIRGTAVNNDGGAKLSYAAASGTGQALVIARALDRAGFDPATVSLIEAHGTGTYLGDPVEISALTRAFGGVSPGARSCAVGSVKTNIGHLEAAAGIAGLIKTVLALEHCEIPPSLHFQNPNPRINFADSPFYVNSSLQDWPSAGTPRRAGVSSLGIGGTNAFVAIEEAPGSPPPRPHRAALSFEVLCLSARCSTALEELVQRYVRRFEACPHESPADVCYTACVGRTPFPERLAVVADSIALLREKLAAFSGGCDVTGLFRGCAAEAGCASAVLATLAEDDRVCRQGLEDLAQSWVRGAAIDWPEFYRRRGLRRRALPSYPFQRQRYWIDGGTNRERSLQESAKPEVCAALPGRRLASPLSEIQFESAVGVPVWPLLGDHRIYDRVVVPGAWHLALVMAGARQVLNSEGVALREVVFPRALACDEREVRPVQLVFAPSGAECTFRVWSRDQRDQWQLHAQGKCAIDRSEASAACGKPQELLEIETQRHETIGRAEFYRRMRDRHVDLGVSFQWNVRVSITDGQIKSCVAQPVSESGGFLLHPGLIDACIQVAVAQLPPTSLPLSIDLCRIVSLSQTPATIVARIRQTGETDPDVTTVDVDVSDDAGGLVLKMEGLTLKRASRDALLGPSAEKRVDQHRSPRALRNAVCPRLAVPNGRPYALRILRRGNFANLEIHETERRPPAPGEVEIEVRAAGLNFRDVLNTLGAYPGEAGDLGLECAGVVAAVGKGVTDFQQGDEVIAVAWKSFAAFVVTPALLVAPKPRRLSFEQAATVPVAFLTATFALGRLAPIRTGQRILIHAAAGGVGQAAVQVARRAGAEIFATAGSDEKREYLRTLGLPHVFGSRSIDFAAEVRNRSHDQGIDVVLNSLIGEFIPASLSVVRAGGHFIELGKTGIWDPQRVADFRPDISYSTVALDAMFTEQTAFVGSLLREVAQAIETGDLSPLPLQAFPVTEADVAFQFMAQARHIGKVVIRLAGTRGCHTDAEISTRPPCGGTAPAGFEAAAAASRPWDDIRDMPIEVIRDRLVLHVENQLRELLELDNRRPLDRSRPLTEMGMDSMMAVQLINSLQQSTRCRLPATLAFHRPTIDALTEALVEEVHRCAGIEENRQ
jgi:acyl transferase domain-containing protein/NADPH:quinone reductase-like Zn-dependent oxidoreductase/acyl carrier protein